MPIKQWKLNFNAIFGGKYSQDNLFYLQSNTSNAYYFSIAKSKRYTDRKVYMVPKHTIPIKLYGILADLLEEEMIEVKVEHSTSVRSLLKFLKTTYPVLQTIPFRVAVNAAFANDDQEINTGDEIALLPPFSGG